jgi:hypothetical protein
MKNSEQICPTCGKIENKFCSNSFHLPKYGAGDDYPVVKQEHTMFEKDFPARFNPVVSLQQPTSIEEAADKFISNRGYEWEAFIAGAKSDAAREYWYQKFKQEQKMTIQQEKAYRLFESFCKSINYESDGVFIIHKEPYTSAKKCALTAVDEIIAALEANSWQNKKVIDYYKEVKTEIEKI